MKISAKSEYGIIALIDVANHFGSEPIQVRNIANRYNLPERFLEQIMTTLKKAGLVKSIRGAHGGYQLARTPWEITLGDALNALDGDISPMYCVSENNKEQCSKERLCTIKDVWEEIKGCMQKTLSAITLKDMCDKKMARERSATHMYYI
ncbi:MAG: Rrf2 family transcriptional regulator [Nitrospirota bacterium]